MKIPTIAIAFAAALALSACNEFGLSGIEDMSATEDLRPPDAEPGACYGREVLPAIFETVTQHYVLTPKTYDLNGALISRATYRTETVQKVVRERENNWFKTPCAADTDDKFVASVQRALKARGLYSGRITGLMDQKTRRSVRKFQQKLGLDSGTLSLMAARKLGLVAVERDKT